MASQLIGIERLDVAAVILEKVAQAVVQEDRGPDVVGNGELQRADWCVLDLDAVRGRRGVQCSPPLRSDGAIRRLEGGRELVIGNGLELARRSGVAVAVVNHQLLHLENSQLTHCRSSSQVICIALTDALAHRRRPPMGAKMMPTAKKMGRTVLGVKIGLRRDGRSAVSFI